MRPAPGHGRTPRPRPSYREEEGEDSFDELDEYERDPESYRRRRGHARPRGRPSREILAPGAGGALGRLFGGRRSAHPASRGRGRVDWEAVDEVYEEEEYGEEEPGYEEYEEEAPRRRPAGPARKAGPARRATLVELCTPLFGLAAILPREAGGIHPGYQQLRQEVLRALQRIESEAPQHRIEREDAAEARYALALFMDEQVAGSEWSGRVQWAGEPLNVVLLSDPEGGLNFFKHLEQLGERQREVRKIFLLCLALGYRGKYAELDPAQQAAQIGEIRQRLLRSIQEPLERQDVLFPEAYEPAIPLEVPAPPPPRWWLGVSVGTALVVLLVWLGLFIFAGYRPLGAQRVLGGLFGPGRKEAVDLSADPLAPAAQQEEAE